MSTFPSVSLDLARQMVASYTGAVMRIADIPEARRSDVSDSALFSTTTNGEILCTCTITGSTYREEWEGTPEQALNFAVLVGEDTGELIRDSRYYAWLRAQR